MSKDKATFRIDRSVFFLDIRIAISLVLFLAVSILMIFDIIHLGKFNTQRTMQFAQDLTFQHAANISKEFNTKMLNVSMIADSLLQTNSTAASRQLEEFLERKTGLSIFSELHFVGIDDIPQGAGLSTIRLPGHEVHLPSADDLHDVHGSERSYITTDNLNSIYYVQQIAREDELLGLLVGIRSRSDLQDLVQLKVLNNETVSCIVDRNARMVVAPTNRHLPDNLNLDDFVLFKDTADNATAIQQLKEDVAGLRTGTYTVRNANSNSPILITYTPLGINNWGLLTFIPENLIAFGVNSYILRTFAIAIIVICLFGVITITAFISYKNNKRQMERLAFHDLVTGGLNNEGFHLRFKEIVCKARPNTHSVILLNMRNFKIINELYGKENGDRVLRHIHHAIADNMRTGEFAARISADRFFICLQEHKQDTIEGRLMSICREVNAFNSDMETPYLMEFHCGVVIVDKPHTDITQLQDHALHAYDQAVRDNRFCVLYQDAFTERLLKNQELDRLFSPSIKNGDFKLYLQPKVNLETGVVCGAEALVRWVHPEKGPILPSDFIPLLEGNGRICQLDVYMFEEVCKVVRRWQEQGRQLIPISVNLSRQHYFHNPQFLATFADLAQEYKIPPKILDFELTESIFFDNDKFSAVKRSLEEMHELGFLCSLDDFGVGFSSLGLLKEFDIDTIKFDRQFFIDVSTQKSKTILESLMEMSEKLGIKTVAEGIETHEQLNYLNGTCCHMIQGYIFSMPLGISEFEQWLDSLENRRPPATTQK